MDEKTIRLSIPIDREINNQLAAVLPQGLKAQVIRELVELFISSQIEMGDEVYLANYLLKKRVKMTVQILNKS